MIFKSMFVTSLRIFKGQSGPLDRQSGDPSQFLGASGALLVVREVDLVGVLGRGFCLLGRRGPPLSPVDCKRGKEMKSFMLK